MAYNNPLLVYEIIEKASKAKTRAEKIEVLQSNDHWAVRDVLRGTFDDSIVWNLPSGTPPYEAAREESVPSNLLKRNGDFKYFIKGGPGDELPAVKRESIFIRLVEAIHPRDAELLIFMINKRQLAKGITKKLVEEAFPGLIRK